MCDCSTCQALDAIQGPPGLNGRHAYTVTTNSYVQPAVGADVTINVSAANQYSALGLNVGGTVHVYGGGYYTLMSITNPNQIVIRNLGIATNAAVGATVATAATVTNAGAPGTTGTNGADGVAIIDAIIASATTNQTALTTAQHSVTIAANTWSQNKDTVEWEGLILKEKTSSMTHTLRVSVGGNNLVLSPVYALSGTPTADITMDTMGCRINIKLTRTDSDKLRVNVIMKLYQSSTSYIGYSTEAIWDFSTPNDFDYTAQILSGLNFAATIAFNVTLSVADATGSVKLAKSILTKYKK